MCRMLTVNRSSFYRWCARRDRPPSPRIQRRQTVTDAIRRLFTDCQGRVGRRPVRTLLARQGVPVSLGMVHRIMAEQGLVAARRQAFRRTTRPDPAARTAHIRNHCLDAAGHRDFASDTPGARCVGDITYLPTREGWLYLAVVVDLATRAVVGWAMQPHLRSELVIEALAMARTHGHVRHGTIFHSDRGAQYTGQPFQDWCAAQGVMQSMGAVGVCWDNAVAESFFATLKSDLASHTSWATRAGARTAVVSYIEGWYNRRRPHQYTDGVPPMVALEGWVDHRATVTT